MLCQTTQQDLLAQALLCIRILLLDQSSIVCSADMTNCVYLTGSKIMTNPQPYR